MKAVRHGTQKKFSNYENVDCAAVALTYNHLVILCRRIDFCPITKSPVKFGGYWSIFAGSIESGETPQQAGVREVKEESGIDIKEEGLSFLGQIRTMALFAYELEEMKNVKLNFEHTEWGYFKIPEIHSSPDPIDLDVARAIQYHNFINS